MCGICGMLGLSDEHLLKKMCEVMVYRGPDDHGVFLDSQVGLGSQRLSIIDLGGGHQPMCNEDGSVWLAYNGEIYNYLELKAFLEKRGHKFRTACDTEVIIHLYEEMGDLCVNMLRGMFAFAIWDSGKNRLLLARDRVGIKPLYYTVIDGVLLFGSEIKSLLQLENLGRTVNRSALYNFLTFQYVPGPETIFKGIWKLLPGHMLTYADQKLTVTRYWDLEPSPFQHGNLATDYTERLRELLTESVKMELMSDVPLGAYLSGGVDSSSVVGFMKGLVGNPIKTFSVGFGDEAVDEIRYARVVADYFETDHHELIVQSDSIKLLPEIIWHLDEPIADPATIPTYLISELAKRYVKVVLTGEGADELFAGYKHYQYMLKRDRLLRICKMVPKPLRSRLAPRLTKISPKSMEEPLRYIANYEEKEKNYIRSIAVIPEEEKRDLCTDEFYERIEYDSSPKQVKPYFDRTSTSNLLDRMLYVDIKTWLPDDLLMKVDKMTMAHSVEARVPYLDHEFMGFAMAIPPSLKVAPEKYILRKSMAYLLPREIVEREKHGFTVPIGSWYGDELAEIIQQLLAKERIEREGFFRYNYVDRLLRRKSLSRRLWVLLIFELWHQIYIENKNLYNPRLSLNDLL